MSNSISKTKVLFLAWGYSIHARRRIEIFTEDPSFEICVVATHDYQFKNALNITLNGRPDSSHKENWETYRFLESQGLQNLSEIKEDIDRGIFDFKILKQAVDSFQPDVIFLQTLMYPCYLSYFLPREIPKMVTFWNGDVTWWAKWNGIERFYKKKIVTHGAQSATAITVNSEKAREACLQYDVDPKKVHLIRYPGVDLKRFQPGDSEKAKEKLGIAAKKVILCPRGLGAYLNSDQIVEAASFVLEKNRDALFLFVSGVGGEETWRQHLKRAKELGISNFLRRDGQVPWEKMPLYYQAANAMVSVSSNDSLPNCMLEAMACGVPLVMGDIPTIRDWVKPGHNGYLVNNKNPKEIALGILEALKDKNEQFARRNQQIVSRKVNGDVNSKKIKNLVHQFSKKEIYEYH